MKKTLCLWIVLCMLCGVLVSCVESENKQTDNSERDSVSNGSNLTDSLTPEEITTEPAEETTDDGWSKGYK